MVTLMQLQIILTVFIIKNQHLRGIYNGTVELEMERAIEDIELLLKEN